MADTKPPTGDELAGILAELRCALDDFEHGARVDTYDATGRRIGEKRTPNLGHLWILLSAARRDGYRTNSLGAGAPQSVVDENGAPMPPLSDPCGEVAADEVKVRDPIRLDVEHIAQNLVRALGAIRAARGRMIQTFQGFKVDLGEPGCSAHAAAGIYEEATKAGRCRWCYDFWLAKRVDPPVEILQARSIGKRITERMVAEALRPAKPGPKKGRAA